MDISGLVLVFAGGKGDEEHGPSGEDQFTGDDGSQEPCGRLRKGCNDDDTEAEGDDTVENQPSFTRNFADAHAGEQAEDSSEYEEPADNQSERGHREDRIENCQNTHDCIDDCRNQVPPSRSGCVGFEHPEQAQQSRCDKQDPDDPHGGCPQGKGDA